MSFYGVLDFITEASTTSVKKTIKNELRLLYSHMLKYQYQQYKQSASWIKTIRASKNEIIKVSNKNKSIARNVFSDEQFLINVYRLSLIDFTKDTGITNTNGFNDPSSEFMNIDLLLYSDYIEKFLIRYAYTDEVKKYLNL